MTFIANLNSIIPYDTILIQNPVISLWKIKTHRGDYEVHPRQKSGTSTLQSNDFEGIPS